MNKLVAFLTSAAGLSAREVPVPYAPSPDESPCPFEPTSAEMNEAAGELASIKLAAETDKLSPAYLDATYEAEARAYNLLDAENTYEAFLSGRYPDRWVQPGNLFVWQTNDGHFLPPKDMKTPHVFYTLRMLFNHSVPPAFRVGEFKRRKHVDEWPLAYRVQASNAMQDELSTREDVEDWMRHEMNDMALNNVFIQSALSGVQRVSLQDYKLNESDLNVISDQLTRKITPVRRDEARLARQAVRRGKVKPGKVRGYTRADGSKVRGYKRS